MPRCVISSRRGRGAHCRRSVLEQSLRCSPLEARRTAFSVALAIFWRMRGEVQQPRTVAPGHDKYYSGLRDRPEGPGPVSSPRSAWTTPPQRQRAVEQNLEPLRHAQTCRRDRGRARRRAVNTGSADRRGHRALDRVARSGRRAAPARTTTFWTRGSGEPAARCPVRAAGLATRTCRITRFRGQAEQDHGVPGLRLRRPGPGDGVEPAVRPDQEQQVAAGRDPGSPPSPGWVQMRDRPRSGGRSRTWSAAGRTRSGRRCRGRPRRDWAGVRRAVDRSLDTALQHG